MALRKTYGLKIESATEELREHFATVRSIARFVASQKDHG
jgi:acyl carrier protein